MSDAAVTPAASFSPFKDLRYPIGRFEWDGDDSGGARARRRAQIAALPKELARAVDGLDDRQLDTPYRPDGWTVRQLVHHVADSHMNAYVRFRLGLTESQPTITAYDEKRWAELPDRVLPPSVSLQLLEALHARWDALLAALTNADYGRTIAHPEWKAPLSLDMLLGLYAWHSVHHTAHVVNLRLREGWS